MATCKSYSKVSRNLRHQNLSHRHLDSSSSRVKIQILYIYSTIRISIDSSDLLLVHSNFINTSVQHHIVSEKQERVDKAMNLKIDYINYPHRNPAFGKLKLRTTKTCKSIFDLANGRPLDSHHTYLSLSHGAETLKMPRPARQFQELSLRWWTCAMMSESKTSVTRTTSPGCWAMRLDRQVEAHARLLADVKEAA